MEKIKLKHHWDKTYSNNPEEKLGWYETDLSPTLRLVSKTALKNPASMLIVGAGSTTLIDELIELGYPNLIATDLSKVALNKLKVRTGDHKVTYIVDDLTNPDKLLNIPPVDLWIDRAVLHFFTENTHQETYFDLLRNKVKTNGYAIFAEFSLMGASKCSGLPIFRYSKELLAAKLGTNFALIDHFDHTYIMPSGDERAYVYALFKKTNGKGKKPE